MVEPLYVRSLGIRQQSLGEQHPQTQTTWENFLYLVKTAVETGRAQELSDDPLTQEILLTLSGCSD